MKVIKIIRFTVEDPHIEKAEDTLSKLVNDGWVIITGGGYSQLKTGFVILQREQ